jgi:hypothetical protein
MQTLNIKKLLPKTPITESIHHADWPRLTGREPSYAYYTRWDMFRFQLQGISSGRDATTYTPEFMLIRASAR